MGHNSTLEVLQVAPNSTDYKTVTADTSMAMPVDSNGNFPKFVHLQAVGTSGTGGTAALPGDWITVALAYAAVSGNANAGFQLVVGAPGVVLMAHGYDFISIGWPALENDPTNIILRATALENQ